MITPEANSNFICYRSSSVQRKLDQQFQILGNGRRLDTTSVAELDASEYTESDGITSCEFQIYFQIYYCLWMCSFATSHSYNNEWLVDDFTFLNRPVAAIISIYFINPIFHLTPVIELWMSSFSVIIPQTLDAILDEFSQVMITMDRNELHAPEFDGSWIQVIVMLAALAQWPWCI